MAATLAQLDAMYGPIEGAPSSAPSNDYGSGGESSQPKSPLESFQLMQGTGAEKKVKADGQPPKRRGPKPDSKPALTRRQELNRQAQRTHRERKELYIKALETEVMHLKELFATTTQERENLAKENAQLRELLARHGITVPPMSFSPASTLGPQSETHGNNPSTAPTSASFSPRPQDGGNALQVAVDQSVAPVALPAPRGTVNYEQVGIDFVLTLERPCMDHAQMLCVKAQQSEEEISGHALHFSCPTERHLIERPEKQYPHQPPPGLAGGDLMKLLNLSNSLALDAEITPVMAFATVLRSNAGKYLEVEDFEAIRDDLLPRIRCYGFGACLEEWEVHDAIGRVVNSKMEVRMIEAC